MSFQTRLRERREAMGLSRAELAQRLGITPSAISNYENGVSNPKADILYAVFDALRCDANYLFQDEMNEKPDLLWVKPLADAYQSADESTQRAACAVLKIGHVTPGVVIPNNVVPFVPKNSIKMPVASDSAAAGIPIYAESDFEFIDFAEEDVPTGADFGVRISGDSMEPTISDEDIVWVRKQPAVSNGDVGVFMLGDSAVCKRAKLDATGRLKSLESDNSAYAPITGYDLADVRCVGKVLFNR